MKAFPIFVFCSFAVFVEINGEELFAKTLECHPGYDKEEHEKAHNICMRIYKGKTYSCYKACMLNTFSVILPADGDGYPVRMEDHAPPDATNGIMYSLVRFMEHNSDLQRSISERIIDTCAKEIVPINEKKLPCDNWDGLYACVENAMKC